MHAPVRHAPKLLLAALLGATLTTGCDLLAGPSFPGIPLVTLRGDFLGNVSAEDRPDHLAFAWLNYDLRRTDVEWVSTQEVPFAGSVPLTYEFALYAPPPEALLNDNGYGTGKIAYGTLLAYRDLNGNGALDPIPVGGGIIDRIVGVSSDFVGSPTAHFYEVTYVVGEPPPAPAGLRPGFNLVSHDGVVPMDTPLPITLGYRPVNNLFLCQAIASDTGPTDAEWNGCLGPGPVRTFGALVIQPSALYAVMSVYSGEGLHADAEVTVNGVPLAYDPENAQYYAADATRTLFTPGSTAAIRIAVPGYPVDERLVPVLGEFAITSPDDGSSFARTQSVPVRWTESAGAWRYQLQHTPLADGFSPRRYGTYPGTPAVDLLPPPGLEGLTAPLTNRVTVSAYNRLADDNGTDLAVWVRHAVYFDYVP